MYLDYSKLAFNADGNPVTPELVLKTMGEETIGIIPGVHNLKLNIKFSEPSEMSFDVPALIDDEPNWIYEQLGGHKLIYTESYGIYVSMNPSTESDGISEVKHIKAYSIEKTLDSKKFFFEEGTFKFYEQSNPRSGNTIMGRILEIAVGWNPGRISPNIAQRYRTFEQYDDYLLSFIYNTAPEKYRCVFVFDPYDRTISVLDADDQTGTIPIYLDFDNLLTSMDVEELSDELVTAIRPYGADGLDIQEVNPIGTNWIYDLSYFIANGDIQKPLADKWKAWQQTVLNNRERYRGLSALRASTTLSLMFAQAKLADLQGELAALQEKQNVAIQAIARGDASQQQVLSDIHVKINGGTDSNGVYYQGKQNEITAQEGVITTTTGTLNGYKSQIDAIVEELDIAKAFTAQEYKTLSMWWWAKIFEHMYRDKDR